MIILFVTTNQRSWSSSFVGAMVIGPSTSLLLPNKLESTSDVQKHIVCVVDVSTCNTKQGQPCTRHPGHAQKYMPQHPGIISRTPFSLQTLHVPTTPAVDQKGRRPIILPQQTPRRQITCVPLSHLLLRSVISSSEALLPTLSSSLLMVACFRFGSSMRGLAPSRRPW